MKKIKTATPPKAKRKTKAAASKANPPLPPEPSAAFLAALKAVAEMDKNRKD
jgi:hypothetical protein